MKKSLLTLNRILWRRIANGENRLIAFRKLCAENGYQYDENKAHCFLCMATPENCKKCPGTWGPPDKLGNKMPCTSGNSIFMKYIYENDPVKKRKLAIQISRCADKPRTRRKP